MYFWTTIPILIIPSVPHGAWRVGGSHKRHLLNRISADKVHGDKYGALNSRDYEIGEFTGFAFVNSG